jgi:peptidoglycan/LPS O-acetylase OafA/YrhL
MTSSVSERTSRDITERKPSFYKPELDILRFVAFLSVFIVHSVNYSTEFLVQHHVPLWAAKIGVNCVRAGIYGVDLFFVLSAYLITGLLLREKETKGYLNVRAFYLRRMLRIWPLYYLFIAVVALVPALNHHDFGPRYVLPFLALMGNWSFIVFGVPVWIVVPLWSISVEEQFYLLWPPVVAKLSRRQIVVAAVTMIGVANVSRLLVVALHQTRHQLWFNTFAHLDSIAAGILLAVFWRQRVWALKCRLGVVAVASCCLAARACFDIDGNAHVFLLGTAIGDPIVALSCTALLASVIDLPFKSRVLQYLGKISYGLYVYHVMVLTIVDELFPGGGHGPIHACLSIVLSLGLTIALSAVSYAVVERPFLNIKERFAYISSRPV